MAILKKLRQYLSNSFFIQRYRPEMAYNLWADSYDSQPDNLMLALDEEVFTDLLNILI